ncbi:DNA-directed RNA polymerase subunit beta [Lentibacillus lipolyticus]|nr:DNA-directed RNA polymerase subunit beta [Lentibacillus lipolyticus]
MSTKQKELAGEKQHTNDGEQPAGKERETQQAEPAEQEAALQSTVATDEAVRKNDPENHPDAAAAGEAHAGDREEPIGTRDGQQQAEGTADEGEEQYSESVAVAEGEGQHLESAVAAESGAEEQHHESVAVAEPGAEEQHLESSVAAEGEEHLESAVVAESGAEERHHEPVEPEPRATSPSPAAETRTERRQAKTPVSKLRRLRQGAASAKVQPKPQEETAADPDEQQQQQPGVAPDKATRKEQKKKQKAEKRRNKKPRRRIFPIWLRIIAVLVLSAAALAAGLMIGYGVIGDGNPTDALKWETWQHIIDIVVKQK